MRFLADSDGTNTYDHSYTFDQLIASRLVEWTPEKTVVRASFKSSGGLAGSQPWDPRLEVYITLEWLLVDRHPTLVEAIAFEALNRVITAAFKFVPFRVGIDEASAGALAPVLSVNPAAGVALAVVRKVRNLFWAALGLVPVATHPAAE